MTILFSVLMVSINLILIRKVAARFSAFEIRAAAKFEVLLVLKFAKLRNLAKIPGSEKSLNQVMVVHNSVLCM